jgi:hypothetical protein
LGRGYSNCRRYLGFIPGIYRIVQQQQNAAQPILNAYAYVGWDSLGNVTFNGLTASPDGGPSTGAKVSEFVKVELRPPGFETSIAIFDIAVTKADGYNVVDTGGLYDIPKDIFFHDDGSIELTQEGLVPWSYEGGSVLNAMYELHIIMAASDGSGASVDNPCEGGEINDDGMITFIDRRKLRDGIRNCNLDYNFSVLAARFANAIGAQGPAGPDGVDGTLNNVTGPIGADGVIGLPGPNGLPGAEGPEGNPGIIGIPGPDNVGDEIIINGGGAFFSYTDKPIVEGGGA